MDIPSTHANGASASIVLDAANPRHLAWATEDLLGGLRRWRLASALAWLDIRNRYRGSVLGPFWLSLSTAVMLLGIGVLYSVLLRTDIGAYLPYLAVSLICWNMLAQTVTDACGALTGSEAIIRQVRLPFTVHIMRCVLRNAIVAAHNLPLIAIVLLIFRVTPGWSILLLPLGLGLLALNAFAASMFLGMICARFRDVAQIVASVIQIFFFLSPILWKPETLREYAWTVMLNPFYLLMETVRAPLIEDGGSPAIWALAIAVTAASVLASFAFFVRFRSRIAFWV